MLSAQFYRRCTTYISLQLANDKSMKHVHKTESPRRLGTCDQLVRLSKQGWKSTATVQFQSRMLSLDTVRSKSDVVRSHSDCNFLTLICRCVVPSVLVSGSSVISGVTTAWIRHHREPRKSWLLKWNLKRKVLHYFRRSRRSMLAPLNWDRLTLWSLRERVKCN